MLNFLPFSFTQDGALFAPHVGQAPYKLGNGGVAAASYQLLNSARKAVMSCDTKGGRIVRELRSDSIGDRLAADFRAWVFEQEKALTPLVFSEARECCTFDAMVAFPRFDRGCVPVKVGVAVA